MPHLTAMTTARRRSAMVPAAVLAIPTPALATIFTWDGGSGVNNNFSSGFNWNPSSAPPLLSLSTSDLVFGGALRTSPNAEAAYQVNSITFAVNAASFNITGAATLTLNHSGITTPLTHKPSPHPSISPPAPTPRIGSFPRVT